MGYSLNNRIHTQPPDLPRLGEESSRNPAEALKQRVIFALASVQIAHSGLGHEEVERRIGELRTLLCHPGEGQDLHRPFTLNSSASVEILKQVQDDMGFRFTHILQSNSVPEILRFAAEIAREQSQFNFRRDVFNVFVSNLHFNAHENPS